MPISSDQNQWDQTLQRTEDILPQEKDPDAVYVDDISIWCCIDFDANCSNPLEYANKLYANGNLITNLIVPDGITKMKSYAFSGYQSLVSVVIPNSVTYISRSAFEGCSNLTDIVIPNSVIYILNEAFQGCSNLTNVTLSNSITDISRYTFQNCKSLTNITIPDNVKWIRQSAFEGCFSLTEITIPDKVSEIGSDVFKNCYVLNTIICKPTTPPTGGSSMFASIGSSPKIYVPVGSGETYKAAQYWSDYADIIEEKEM